MEPTSLPVFLLSIDEDPKSDLEVSAVALVDRPAIEKNFLAFKENPKPLQFATDDEQRVIFGPAMLADRPIYRNDSDLGEYLVLFNKETIEQIVKKFFSKGYNQSFNLSHDPNQKQDNVFVFQSFITNEKLGVKPLKGFEDAPEGSWFMAAKVESDELWQRIKSGEFQGFSVEGMFEYKRIQMQEQMNEDDKQLIETLTAVYDFLKNHVKLSGTN